MVIHSKTRTVELFRLMYATGGDGVPIKADLWTADQRAAHVEWDRRLETCRAEHGSAYDRERRYEAYCDGRADELKARSEDLRIAKILLAALTAARIAVPSDLTADDLLRLAQP